MTKINVELSLDEIRAIKAFYSYGKNNACEAGIYNIEDVKSPPIKPPGQLYNFLKDMESFNHKVDEAKLSQYDSLSLKEFMPQVLAIDNIKGKEVEILLMLSDKLSQISRREGGFKEINDYLCELNPNDISVNLIMGFLTSTASYNNYLPNILDFYNKAYISIQDRGRDPEKLIKNLK